MKQALKEKRMLSVRDLQERFGISYGSAYAMMLRLPCINVAPPTSKYKQLRVSCWAVDQYEKQARVHA